MFYQRTGGRAQKFVSTRSSRPGANPCPNGIIGVASATPRTWSEARKGAIVRPVGERIPDPQIARMEAELEDAINAMGRAPWVAVT
jgi:tartrate dehydratase alpha subunit/fumarate hydratase class I-like protein